MAQITKQITLDVMRENDVVYFAKQGDTASRFLKIRFTSAGLPITLSAGDKVILSVQRADEETIYILGNVASDGTAIVELVSNALSTVGTANCDVSIISALGEILSCLSFAVEVQEGYRDDTALENANEFPIFVKAISEMGRIEADIKASESARAVFEEYDSKKKYTIGNKVSFLGSSYVLIKDAPAGTLPTDADYWLLFAARGERGKPGSATNLTDGEGVGSVESIDSGKAISDNTVALGKDTVAGCKGYYIKSIDLENKKIYLCKEKVKPEISTADNTDESFGTPAYEVGAEFNIVNGNHYILCASIAAIKNNAVTYKGDLGFSTIVEDDGIDGHTFSVPSQPEIGIVSIADGTASFGDGNKASAQDAFTAGRDNVAAGDFGAVFGRENVGGYGTLVSGRGNYSPGQCSSTGGANNKNTGYCTDVHGQGLIGSGGAQTVRGTYNIPDKNSKFVEIIGNGKGDAQRSNARTVDRDGNAHHAGDVFAHSEWDENGVKKQGDRLVTASELNMVETKFDDQLNLKKPLYTGLQTRGFVYTPGSIPDCLNVAAQIDEKTGILYNHTTINNTKSTVCFSNYSINPRVTANGGTLYYKLLMRTNMKVNPAMVVLNPYDKNGAIIEGAFTGVSEVPTTPNGEWEQHIIVVDNLPSNATTFNHVRTSFAGRGLIGSSFYNGTGTLTSNAYFDVAGWAVFDDLDRARAYDLTVDASDETKYGYDVQKNIDEKASKNLSNIDNEALKSKLAEIGYNLDSSVKIATGSYVGTGTGFGTYRSLTFDFVPLVLIIDNPNITGYTWTDLEKGYALNGDGTDMNYGGCIIATHGQSKSYLAAGLNGTSGTIYEVLLNGTTLSIELDDGNVFNQAGKTYHYTAIG